MNKLFQLLDKYLLKIGVALIIAFIPLYPKLPSIAITHTWVYIRLEDFLIGIVVAIWLIQLIRKKVSLPFSLGIPFAIYWFIGLCSLVFSVIFIGPHLANYFPKIAALEYARRIEYMILFFVGFSAVRSKKDIRDFLIILGSAFTIVLVYGLGQRFYLGFWAAFPDFARKFTFCFPSFQTGNEEFAKGIPLCLPDGARITSTFGGHYDLAAYLVIIIPVFVGLFAVVKQWRVRIITGLLSIGAIMLLIFTASRISFAAYLIGVTVTLVFLKRKRFILPIFLISLILLVSFSSSLAKRFLETVRFTSIVTNNQGQVVGVASNTLPADLQKKIASSSAIEENVPTQNLPTGSSFITLPSAQTPVATNVAVVKTSLTNAQQKELQLKNGGVEISTVSGKFLIQKALVYDISFTTRFQGEWPNAWAAFMRNPLLGSGYSSITLASDNDYLRALGESGALGLCSLLLVFLFFGIFVNKTIRYVHTDMEKALILGLSGGVLGLFINASLIDVFEASKVAESLWILLGIGAGSLMLYQKHKIMYWRELLRILFSPVCIAIYFLILAFILYGSSINNYFVGDDFTWLHWAAASTAGSIKGYFLNSTGFFYRPLAKSLIFLFYTFFSLYPQGYRVVMIFLHFFMALGVYLLAGRLLKNRYMAFFAGVLFLLLPGRAENFFWISTFSIALASVFILYSSVFFIKFREQSSLVSYIFSLIFALLGVFSYEGAIVYPLLIIAYDLFFVRRRSLKKILLPYIPYAAIVGIYACMRIVSNALGPNGDYSYSIVHLIPNVFGNLIGYVLLFLFGESALPWYTLMRVDLKSFTVLIIFAFILVIIALGFFWRNIVKTISRHTCVQMALFLLLFVIIGLLPFLGLGNITQRYGYFSSVGFVILLVFGMFAISSLILSKKQYGQYLASIVLVVFCIFGFIRIQSQNTEWAQAGHVTNSALAYIKVYADDVTPGAYFYFVNVPIKYQNAWVFPVGLEDGLWFMYRDPSLHIVKTDSLDQAKLLQSGVMSATTAKTYIFSFDNKGNIKEEK